MSLARLAAPPRASCVSRAEIRATVGLKLAAKDKFIMTSKVKHIGPHSRVFGRGAVGKLNGRSREGRYLRDVEVQLLEHVGPSPTVTQRILVSRASRAMLRLKLFDEKMSSGEEMTVSGGRIYGALHNALRLCLREFGLKGKAPAKAPSLQDIARRHAEPVK